MNIQQTGTEARRQQIASMKKAGLTYAEIGRRWGLSRERIRQIDKEISVMKKPKPKLDVMLMPSKVARILGVHVNTVRRWSNKGILKTYRIGPRGDRRLRRRDVDNFLLRKTTS